MPQNVYAESCRGDARYVWDAYWYSTALGRFWRQGKLPDAAFLEHHLPYGEWTYGQRYMEQYLHRIGMENPIRALLDRPDTYYVGSDPTFVLTYLQEHMAPQAAAEPCGELAGVPLWRFSA